MQAYWILPNRDQKDDLLASDGERIIPLRQVLEPRRRPEGFSHGVPTELLEKCGPKLLPRILFAQRFPEWNAGKQLFAVSTPAGVDSSGRLVHLGMLFILDAHESPSFDLSYAALPQEEQPHARALLQRVTSPQRDDSWAQSVRELIELAARRGPATNVELQRSVVPFYSLYAVGPGGLTKKRTTWRKLLPGSTIILLVLAALGICLGYRGCQHSTRPLVCDGGAIWRFS